MGVVGGAIDAEETDAVRSTVKSDEDIEEIDSAQHEAIFVVVKDAGTPLARLLPRVKVGRWPHR